MKYQNMLYNIFLFLLLVSPGCSFVLSNQMSYKQTLKLETMRQRREKAEYKGKLVYSLSLTGNPVEGFTYNIKVRVKDVRFNDFMRLSLLDWINEVIDVVEIYTGKRDLEMMFDEFQLKHVFADRKKVLIEGTNKGYDIVFLLTDGNINGCQK